MNATTLAHRQLSALRRTYPGWEIVRGRDGSGCECWEARLRIATTEPMRQAGVAEVIRGPDVYALSSALARQQSIVHLFRTSWPTSSTTALPRSPSIRRSS
ncbi:hypothetical protein ABGB14_46900 [Nonomuraea sp. B10E15]|uniref:hypothetical protein n=1 Tax=Nonomuraea sp. B10E15 TaxID=3153560 RepID=UPI00325E42C8